MQQAPPGWGKDTVGEFIETAQRNTLATYVHLQNVWRFLVRIDRVFHVAIDNMLNTRAWFAVLFLLRAHASFLGAVRLSASGQVPEAHMVMRGCLENSLYGLFIEEHPELQEVWLTRHDDEASRDRVRTEFKVGRMLELLRSKDSSLGNVVSDLYEHTIDSGGHPNERALSENIEVIRAGGMIKFELAYLANDIATISRCVRTNARVGVQALKVFRMVFPERFDLLGLSGELSRLSRGV